MITVIIPSKGRDRLKFSLLSLLTQNQKDWKCIVAFDNVDKNSVELINDSRIEYIFLPAKTGDGNNGGGEVRNKAIDKATTEWICFLDDDDSFTSNYFDKFNFELNNNRKADVIIFKMQYTNGVIRPCAGVRELQVGQVGISFAVNLSFLNKHNLRFRNSNCSWYSWWWRWRWRRWCWCCCDSGSDCRSCYGRN
jgi:glycosyltransferase involved in cell wall biosynthesis